MTNFCTSCGLRIVAPGQCKVCDPVAGQNEAIESSLVAATKSASSDEKPAQPGKKG